MYRIPPDELAMQQREAVETEMLSIEQIDDLKELLLAGVVRLPQVNVLCAMARRSAIREAAGKVLPEEPSPDRLHELADEIDEDGLHDTSNFLHAYARNVLTIRTHATVLQSKLAESQLAADDANLSAIAAKEETELLRKRLSEVEAENARFRHEKDVRDAERITKWAASVATQQERAESAESRLREVTAERDALKEILVDIGGRLGLAMEPVDVIRRRVIEYIQTGKRPEYPVTMHDGVRYVNIGCVEYPPDHWAMKLEDKLTAANLRAETAWERAKEACAKVCEDNASQHTHPYWGAQACAGQARVDAAAIRQLKEPANGNG